ncbi:MAG: hypothetical protein HYX65_11640 [Gemmatimonadetes bacterium]|nr:hypothetical protein [Gemmatimonadota bacterium]
MRMLTLRLLVGAVIAVVASPRAATAQNQEADRISRSVPRSVARELLDVYNAPRTRRESGPATIEEGEDVRGDVAVQGGPLTVRGRVRGRVIAINSDVRLAPGSRIEGDVLVAGGTLEGRTEGWIGGDVRVYRERVALNRDRSDVATEMPVDRDPDDDAWWTRWRSRERAGSSLLLSSAKTYNRVEGFPLVFGPLIRKDLGVARLSVDALAIFRTIQGWQWNPQTVGHRGRLELRFGNRNGVAVGGKLYDVIDGTETWQMSDVEVGLASALFQRDFRDYYGRHGGQAYVRLFAGDGGELTFGYANETWKNALATNVASLFRLSEGWRALPLVDEGEMRLATVSWTFDTRNDLDDPTNGWWVRADYERGEGRLARVGYAPLAGATFVNPEGPATYSRGFLDFRRYNRMSPDAQLNFRIVAGGLLPGSDPLPAQRKLSVSGPGSMPGFAFREYNGLAPNTGECLNGNLYGAPANCDRILLGQIEFRGSLDFNLFSNVFDTFDASPYAGRREPRRSPSRWSSRSRSGGWVLFADAGRGWTVGGNIPGVSYSGRIPEFSTFRTDAGVGFEFDPVGVYYAKALSEGSRPGVWFVRLRHRF